MRQGRSSHLYACLQATDAFEAKDLGIVSGRICVEVEPTDIVLLRLTPADAAAVQISVRRDAEEEWALA